MAGPGGKNSWALFLMILAGVVFGGFIGYLTKNISILSWLNYGQTFGLSDPFILNLGIMVITFGVRIRISMSGLLGVILAIFIYRRL